MFLILMTMDDHIEIQKCTIAIHTLRYCELTKI